MYDPYSIRNVYSINNEFFILKWFMTSWCNYKCPYCVQGEDYNKSDYNLNKHWIDENILIEKAKKINHILIKLGCKKKLSMVLLGGEVTFYNLPKILAEIDNIATIFITTNFSNTIDYYKNLYTYCDSRNIRLVLNCSYHESGDSFFTKIIDLAEWCIDKQYCAPRINFVVGNDFNFDMFDKFPKLINLCPLFQEMLLPDGKVTRLSDDVLEKVRTLKATPHVWFKLNDKFKVRPNRWIFDINGELKNYAPSVLFKELPSGELLFDKVYCDAGVNSFSILANDDIIRCPNNDKVIGNLNDPNLHINLNSSICDTGRCRLCQVVNICRCDQSSFDPFMTKGIDNNEI